MFCPNCGKEQVDNPRFCRNCGARLSLIEGVKEGQKFEGKKEEIISTEEERIFQGIPPTRMKELVIQAAKLTTKVGLTAHSLAWGGATRFRFKGETMRIAVGRKMASMGGTGGDITVTQSNGGSKVRLAWEKDNDKCWRITSIFWKNLAAVLQPGGFKLGPRSAALKWATGLLFAFTAYQLLGIVAGISLFLQQGIKVASFGAFVLFSLTLIAAIYALNRKHWVDVLSVSILLPIATIVSAFLLYGRGLGTLFLPVAVEVVVVFLAQVVCAILISKTKADFV
jgi:hypothetical protein